MLFAQVVIHVCSGIVAVDDFQMAGGIAVPHCHVYDMGAAATAAATVTWKDEEEAAIR